jgi:hypothetical protein
VKSGLINSPVSSATYTVGTASAPTFYPAAGTIVGLNTYANVSNLSPNDTVYYTTNGNAPTLANSTKSANPSIHLTQSQTIQAFVTSPGMANSAVSTVSYTVQASAPTFSLASGAILSAPQDLTISADDGATIYYTTDGTTPDRILDQVHRDPPQLERGGHVQGHRHLAERHEQPGVHGHLHDRDGGRPDLQSRRRILHRHADRAVVQQRPPATPSTTPRMEARRLPPRPSTPQPSPSPKPKPSRPSPRPRECPTAR